MSRFTLPPILITGAARSGTSMTAGPIYFCGAFGGEMSGPTRYNKKGMFENAEIRNNIVKPYLRFLGVDPKGQFPLPDVRSLAPLSGLRHRVEETLMWNGYKAGPWFYKGAKMCLIWPIWAKAFPDAKWIIVRRKTEDIINSCIKTAFMSAHHTEEGWRGWVEEHLKRFEEMKKAGLWIREAWPEKMIHGDFSEMKSLVDELGMGLKWNEKQIVDFITPAFWSVKDGQ
jgi:hypothetical protein